MFKRKKRIFMLSIESGEPRTLPLMEYRLPESAVIELSIRLFNDPEPCHIHREAVRQRVFMALTDACLGKGPVRLTALSPELRLAFPGEGTLSVWEESR